MNNAEKNKFPANGLGQRKTEGYAGNMSIATSSGDEQGLS